MAKVPSRHSCLICASEDLAAVKGFESLVRVTSDSKPWPAGGRLSVCGACGAMQKLVEPGWLEEIGRIYGAYDIYYQSGGAEQPIFVAGASAPVARSARILDHMVTALDLRPGLKVLDFGCGTGSALRTYGARFPDWALYGAELSARSLPLLQKIPGFVQLFTSTPDRIAERFDLITAIHAMEHVTDPVGTLKALAGRLAPGGHLVVQVPDCGRTPYDLVIADHLTHFTLASLKLAALQAGLEPVLASDSVLSKELTWAGRAPTRMGMAEAPAAWPGLPSAADEGRRFAETGVAWLAGQLDVAGRIAAKSPRFGIFGTSISGTWAYGQLADRVAFFVDEDQARVGREHFGRPILAPGAVPADSDVFVPLIPEVAAAVAGRHGTGAVRYHLPPPLGRF